MKEMVKMVLVLAILSLVSGGVLAALSNGLKGQIETQELTFVKGPTLETIMEGSSNNPVDDRFKLTVGEEEMSFFPGVFDGTPKVVALEASASGYADKVGVMVAFNLEDDTLFGIGVTTHKETPGLGAMAKDDPEFATQFKGKSINEKFMTTKKGGNINALSGATITSDAVCAATRIAVQDYKELKPKLVDQLKSLSK